MARSIEVGLDVADEWLPGLARKAAELSVFPENVAIPAIVVGDLWGMDTSDVEEDVLRPLDNLSLLHWDREAGIFRLHTMVDRALDARLEQDAVDASAVHRRLLDAWGNPHELTYDYAWRWFGWHCAHAKEAPRLHQLLLDLDWLRAKLTATDINALIREFDYAEGVPQAALPQGTLRLCAHVLAKDKAQLLRTQLLARVNESAGPLRERLLTEALAIRQPWLRPLRPTLTPPGGPR